jgi:DNA-directed RNA polymerase
VDYFNYQSTDLSRSLILFARVVQELNVTFSKTDNSAIEYLKIFIANCYGLDKESHEMRLKWFSENELNIINFDNSILLDTADNKLLFISSCIS